MCIDKGSHLSRLRKSGFKYRSARCPMALMAITLLFLLPGSSANGAERAVLTVTPTDVAKIHQLESSAFELCEAIRWRIDYEQQRIRGMVESNGYDSYEFWPEDTDVSQQIEPSTILDQMGAGQVSDQTLARMDSASRALRGLDDISFIHFIWEWPINLLQLICYPCEAIGLQCQGVPPYWNPCEAAENWTLAVPFWEDTTTFDIFIVIPGIHHMLGVPWQPQLDMKNLKILIGLFRPIIGFGGYRSLTWSGIQFGVMAGFDVVGGSGNDNGGALEIESPPIPNVSIFIWNRFRDGYSNKEGGGVYTKAGSVNIFIANDIESNHADDPVDGKGGGFYAAAGSFNALIANNIDNNTAGKRGGGATFSPFSVNYQHANRFQGNTAPKGGGVFYEEGTPIMAVKNRYNNNVATTGAGGGMYDDGGIRVAHRREKFSGNTATTVSGGYHRSIPFLGSDEYELDDWRFKGNSATHGGAVYILPDFDGVDIDGCKFDGNQASVEGGAVWIPSNQTAIDIHDCQFLANHAPKGGAVYFVKDSASAATVLLRQSRFGANYSTVEHGGACYFPTAGGTLDINVLNTIFDAINQTPLNGGGLYTTGPGTRLFIDGSKFENNVATLSGAVWADHILEFRITDSRFDGNYAADGGGAIWYGDGDYDNFTIRDSDFDRNSTLVNGGALWVTDGANIDIMDCGFSSNRADSGGAVALNDTLTKVMLMTDQFHGNIAGTVGGALYVAPGTDVDTLDGCVFSGNIASGTSVLAAIDNGLGGGIYIHSESYDEDILRCSFLGNDAAWGGGIALDTFRVPFRIVACSFIGNGASRGVGNSGAGGGIFVNGPDLNIVIGTPAIEDSNYFERNYAESGGGIAVYGGASPIIQNNNFQSNQADRTGDGLGFAGGVLTHGVNSDPWVGGNAVLNEDNTFAFNVAGTPGASRLGRGGAIGIRHGSSPTIQGNHLYFNGATFAGAGIADSSDITDTTIIGGVNDGEIILTMVDPVPFASQQFGNRIFNDCEVPLPDPLIPEPPVEEEIEDSIRICCCYRTVDGGGPGPFNEIPFPPAEGWVPDSTFRFPEEPPPDVVSCSPLVDFNDDFIADAMVAVQSIDTLDWPPEWSTEAFCFEWPDEAPMWPDSNWFPDTSWVADTVAAPPISTIYRRWLEGDYPRSRRDNLDDDYFPDGLGMLDPCRIEGPYVPFFGGGVSVEGVANPVIFGNLIDHNCADSIGGGVWVHETTTEVLVGVPDTLADSLITDHKNFIQRNAAPYGGGVGFAGFSWAPVHNNVVGGRTDSLGNLACYRGGGFYITEGAYPDVGDTSVPRHNLIRHNKAYHEYGGGVAIDTMAIPVLMGNLIFNNRAGDLDPWLEDDPVIADGGGIGIDSTNPTIQFNWIIDNFSADEGGGIYSRNCWGPIDHNTIALNDAFNHGDGVRFAGPVKPAFTNNNVVCYGPWESSGVYSADGLLPATFTNNNVFSRFGYDYYNIDPKPTGMGGNVSLPPLFADVELSDYRLADNSPLLGAGSPGDIGWHYGLGSPLSVSVDTLLVTSGQSIQTAIDLADFGDYVLVDSGLYTEDIILKSGVALHGIHGPDSTIIHGSTDSLAIIGGDSLHHSTSISGLKLVDSDLGIELTGDARPYLFSLVIDSCVIGIAHRDTAVSWIQNNTFHESSVALSILDSLQVLSHNIFDGSVGTAFVMPGDKYPDSTFAHIRHNDFAGGLPFNVEGGVNITGNPQLVAPSECDFHLQCSSPCLPIVTVDSTLIGALDYERAFHVLGGGLVSGPAGDTVDVAFVIDNGSDLSRSFQIAFTDNLGWNLDPIADTVTVNAQTAAVVTVSAAIPGGAVVGTRDSIWCHVTAAIGAACDKDSVRGFVDVTTVFTSGSRLTIRIDEQDIILQWQPFGPPGCEYAVWASASSARRGVEQVGTSRQHTFTDEGVLDSFDRRFYHVSVWDPENPATSKVTPERRQPSALNK